MAVKTKPDKLTLDVRQADAAGLSYGRWRFEETERIQNHQKGGDSPRHGYTHECGFLPKSARA